MNQKNNFNFINQFWDESILPTLMEYIKIPNKSPHFDPNWEANGYMDQAISLISNWCQKNAINKMTLDVVKLENRTPVIFIDIPGDNDETILLYGHLDKQPEMSGWDEDLHPWKPVLRGEKLYGRGGADDGYSVFAALAAVKSLEEQKIPHGRCVILIEACEESGSYDLPFYLEALADRINHPSLIICLDSGCGNYNQLWKTTSLRGLASFILKINVIKEGVHSGAASGIVPSCFQILRQLLSRIEDEKTGDIIIKDLFVEIPKERIEQTKLAAKVLGDAVFKDLPFCKNVKPRTDSITELLLNRSWRPALSVIGMDGLPPIQNAGNVTIPSLTVKLSMRLPPTCDAQKAADIIKKIVEKDPPYHAHIQCETPDAGSGWDAPTEAEWLKKSAHEASLAYFGKSAEAMGEGGSIPFMGLLGKKFPKAQFLITGLLGPESNAHGPNEFLHIPAAKKLTACVAQVIADHFKNK